MNNEVKLDIHNEPIRNISARKRLEESFIPQKDKKGICQDKTFKQEINGIQAESYRFCLRIFMSKRYLFNRQKEKKITNKKEEVRGELYSKKISEELEKIMSTVTDT